jgi:hypothetical protein
VLAHETSIYACLGRIYRFRQLEESTAAPAIETIPADLGNSADWFPKRRISVHIRTYLAPARADPAMRSS